MPNSKDPVSYSGYTSPIVTNAALILWSAGMIVSLYLDSLISAGLFFCLLLLAIMTRIWGRQSIRDVSLSIHCSSTRLFPGDSTVLHYEITNAKYLPLPWLELSQNSPSRNCMEPDSDFTPVHIPGTSADAPPALRQSFAGVMGHSTLTVDHTWYARRRGVYLIEGLRARSGDGFGLTQRETALPHGKMPVIAVYPRAVEVDPSPFLRMQWDTRAGRRGFLEDQTILRGNREYQSGDSWRSINWRMAAREQGLPVNLYQSVSPHMVRFILDGESFLHRENDLEEVLSILGSLLVSLSSYSMRLSLSLPLAARSPAMTLHCSESEDISEMLLALADYDCLARQDPSAAPVDGVIPCLPSLYPSDVIPSGGSTWLITASGSRIPEELLLRIPPASACVLCLEDEDVPAHVGWKAIPIRQLRRDV